MIVGHDKHIAYLTRHADERTLSHGYLFFGPDRVGKKTVAMGLAQYLEAQRFDSASGTVLGDCFLVRPDENKTIGIDAARAITYFLSQRPNRSPYRTVIIDDGECLTTEAQNALLKISEETPASGMIILVVRDPEVIRGTLRSRFQKLYFSPVPAKTIASWLLEELECPAPRAQALGRQAFGAPGRAYALFCDERFRKLREIADALLAASSGETRTVIKKFVEAKQYLLEELLDALIEREYLSARKNTRFIARALALRKQAAFINVNPRLQLEALFS